MLFFFYILGSILIDLFNPRIIGVTGGILSGMSLLSSGFIQDIRIYFLTYGLIFALGQAIFLSATFAILPHYFNKKLPLVNGLINFFGAILAAVFPIILSVFLDKYGLSGTFYFLAGTNFLGALLALTFIPRLPKSNEKKWIQRIKESFGLDVLKKRNYLIWCISTFISIFGYMIPVIVIVSYI